MTARKTDHLEQKQYEYLVAAYLEQNASLTYQNAPPVPKPPRTTQEALFKALKTPFEEALTHLLDTAARVQTEHVERLDKLALELEQATQAEKRWKERALEAESLCAKLLREREAWLEKNV